MTDAPGKPAEATFGAAPAAPTTGVPAATDDVVVLLDDDGAAIGTCPRAEVHTRDTPLHRAFSSYLLDDAGRLLLTRRALTKVAWPGVWTNTCCGHPRPDEPTQDAVSRRVREELGLDVTQLRVVLPSYRYRAVDASGIVEHEICPVLVGRIDQAQLEPHPDEVCEWAWIAWPDAVHLARRTPALLSPWAAEQIVLLAEQLGENGLLTLAPQHDQTAHEHTQHEEHEPLDGKDLA